MRLEKDVRAFVTYQRRGAMSLTGQVRSDHARLRAPPADLATGFLAAW